MLAPTDKDHKEDKAGAMYRIEFPEVYIGETKQPRPRIITGQRHGDRQGAGLVPMGSPWSPTMKPYTSAPTSPQQATPIIHDPDQVSKPLGATVSSSLIVIVEI